jgi:polysaccharide export outer membrane protein
MMKIKKNGYLILIVILLIGFNPVLNADPQTGEQINNDEYTLLPEDVLHVSVWKEEGLQQEVLIQPDGNFSFPLAGHIQAAGKTTRQVEQEITKRLKKYIPDAQVSVSLIKIVGNKVYVIGKVARPGEYVVGRRIDVLQALSVAGGLTPFADANDITIVRKTNGQTEVFPFYYKDIAEHSSNLQLNIELKSGDVVVVP